MRKAASAVHLNECLNILSSYKFTYIHSVCVCVGGGGGQEAIRVKSKFTLMVEGQKTVDKTQHLKVTT